MFTENLFNSHLQTEEEREFEAINGVIIMRKMRQNREGKAHLMDYLSSKQEMRNMKEIGPYKEYMKRKAQEKDEEILWRKFMNKGQSYKEVLEKRKPEFVELLEKKDEETKKDDKNYEDKGTEDNILGNTSNHICSGYCKLAFKEEKQFILKDSFDRTSRRNVSKRKMDKILSHNDHSTIKGRKELEF